MACIGGVMKQPIYTLLAEYNYEGTQVFAFTSLSKAIEQLDKLVRDDINLKYETDEIGHYYNCYLRAVRTEIRNEVKEWDEFYHPFDNGEYYFSFQIQKHY